MRKLDRKSVFQPPLVLPCKITLLSQGTGARCMWERVQGSSRRDTDISTSVWPDQRIYSKAPFSPAKSHLASSASLDQGFPHLYTVAYFLETIISLMSLQPVLLFAYGKKIRKDSCEEERGQHKPYFLVKPDQKVLHKPTCIFIPWCRSHLGKHKSPLHLPVTISLILQKLF